MATAQMTPPADEPAEQSAPSTDALEEALERARELLRSRRPYGARPMVLAEIVAMLDSGVLPRTYGASEAADAMHVRVPNLRKTVGVPSPGVEHASGPVWVARVIDRLAAERAARRSDNEREGLDGGGRG